MSSLTSLGVMHTVISLVTVASGIVALLRDKEILSRTLPGGLYVGGTVLTCVTALFIFQHGGFGPPHALALITLVTLAFAGLAEPSGLFGRAAHYVRAVAYSATLFFHSVPAVIEGTTRLPPSSPLFATQDDPHLQALTGVLFVLFLIGAAFQVRALRRRDQDGLWPTRSVQWPAELPRR